MPTWWTEFVPTVALLISAGALIFNALNVRASAKSKDLEWLFRYLADMRGMEGKLLSSATESERQSTFVEFANYLEVCCYAHNKSLFPKLTKAMVTDNLVNSIAIIENSTYAASFERLLTSSQTFDSLATFRRRHRKPISHAQLAIKSAAPEIEDVPSRSDA
ncbi:hypothetical protein [Mesorhizobium sp. B2-4-17]|uniref:hypothetical protein n=1 Tax=Mesorhizobium sp. B2-4-17 TaxID=2589932 RepID=UPI00112A11D1|nr:hypothetical protein [Mesorhizobium sp. B2-4-17]TPK81165.1 hypothetical protein FJ548_22890 [Mesorhizobium sp. B2-4-17]